MAKTYEEVVFKGTHPENNKAKENTLSKSQKTAALDRAWATRNFEIELYWKRALYFWGFIAIAGAGYFSEAGKEYRLFISCVGLIFSVAWCLANKASKFWQENWECHIDCLEDDIEGRLYKSVMHGGIGWNPLKSYPLSVSNLNQFISIVIVLAWGTLIAKEFSWINFAFLASNACAQILIPLGLAVIIFIMAYTCRTSFMKNVDPFKKLKDRDYFYYERKKTEEK